MRGRCKFGEVDENYGVGRTFHVFNPDSTGNYLEKLQSKRVAEVTQKRQARAGVGIEDMYSKKR